MKLKEGQIIKNNLNKNDPLPYKRLMKHNLMKQRLNRTKLKIVIK